MAGSVKMATSLRQRARQERALQQRLKELRAWMNNDDSVARILLDKGLKGTPQELEAKVAICFSDINNLCKKLGVDYDSLFSDEPVEPHA